MIFTSYIPSNPRYKNRSEIVVASGSESMWVSIRLWRQQSPSDLVRRPRNWVSAATARVEKEAERDQLILIIARGDRCR